MSALKKAVLDWRTWTYSLVSAAIGGGANTMVAMFVDPSAFNFNDTTKLSKLFLGGAIVSVALFLKQSPLPKPEPEEAEPPQT